MPEALSADEITELCLRHTLYDWSTQAGLKPLKLSGAETRQLEAFLGTLVGPLKAPDGFLAPPSRLVDRAVAAAR